MKAFIPVFYVITLWTLSFNQPVRTGLVNPPEAEPLRSVYLSQLGVREATNRNDGPQVEDYLRYVGLKRGNPWCASFVCWCLGQVGISNPRSGYCPNLFPRSKVIWTRGATRTPETGDVFGLYFPDKGRIAHVGFVDEWGEKYAITVEGNTNEAGSREGDGVFRKRRLISTISEVARYRNEQ